MSPGLEQSGARFQTTDWSLVRALRDGSETTRDTAADHLAAAYWPAVYAWLRLQGRSRQDASELTQAFFADVVVGRRLFVRADADRGRLRSLLLTSLKNYLVDQGRRRRGRTEVSLPPEDLEREERMIAGWNASPGDAFERRWAMAILDQALVRCEQHYRRIGRADYWEALKARVVGPAISGTEPPTTAALAAELGFTNGRHVAVAVHSARKLCRTMIESVVAETADSPTECDEELVRVLDVLS